MRSKLALKRESSRVEKKLNKLRKMKEPLGDYDQRDFDFLTGAQQALAWAMEDNAGAPTCCLYGNEAKP
jgi:hypothetical protein